MIAIPSRARSQSSPWISDFAPMSTPRVGSSTIRSFGCVASHLAIKTFAPGTYTYVPCLFVSGRWYEVGAKKSFVVGAPAPVPAPTPVPLPVPAQPYPAGASGAWAAGFADEFNGTSVDWAKWADSSTAEADGGHGNKGNQQLEWNQAGNCSAGNGALTITAKPDSITSPSGVHYDWSSCLLTSSPSYAFQYGFVETRAKFPAARGFWPAFWTWQTAGSNTWIETDVFEYYSDNRTRLYLTQHAGAGGGCTLANLAFDPTTDFHVYGADIKPIGGTDFYIDGTRVCTAAGTSTGPTNLVLDMFVYAQIPPSPGMVASMQVDYVRAWRR